MNTQPLEGKGGLILAGVAAVAAALVIAYLLGAFELGITSDQAKTPVKSEQAASPPTSGDGPSVKSMTFDPATMSLPADRQLNDFSKPRDTNKNGVIDRDEAGGPVAANFDDIDLDKNGVLDGGELRYHFQGGDKPGPLAEVAQRAPSSGGSPAEARTNGDAPAGTPVRVDKVVEQPIRETYPVIGRLVARQAGPISSNVSGTISEYKVSVGDRVKAGDVLAELYDERLEAEVNRYTGMVRAAEAELKKTQQELARAEKLKTSPAFSKARTEDLRQDAIARRGTLAERRAQLRQAQLNLRDSKIRTPYAGIVSEKNSEVGTYVNVGSPIATVINDEALEIEAEVPSARLSGLTEGTDVWVKIEGEARQQAEVRAIVSQEDVRTRTRIVRFTPKFDDLNVPAAANQSVTLDIPLTRLQTAVTIHKDAVVRQGDQDVVYVVSNGNALPKPVRLGDGVGNRFIIKDGVKPGDTVVVRGNERLGGGRPVNIVGTLEEPGS